MRSLVLISALVGIMSTAAYASSKGVKNRQRVDSELRDPPSCAIPCYEEMHTNCNPDPNPNQCMCRSGAKNTFQTCVSRNCKDLGVGPDVFIAENGETCKYGVGAPLVYTLRPSARIGVLG
ncbi:hypothetical protein C8Q70DRAFT_1002231 [Cubamyces menziesii]|nr:hypothetical protein C8Q70DRAFT_1002231 [Cubamyces menziesii]